MQYFTIIKETHSLLICSKRSREKEHCYFNLFSALRHLYSETYSSAITNVTPWSSALEKLIVTQLVKKFAALYGTRKFIAMFARVLDCFVC
jgi:hypothetical protein